jgi:hypothetical protein
MVQCLSAGVKKRGGVGEVQIVESRKVVCCDLQG